MYNLTPHVFSLIFAPMHLLRVHIRTLFELSAHQLQKAYRDEYRKYVGAVY